MLYTEVFSQILELWTFSIHFTGEKTQEKNLSYQSFSVENT